MLGKKGSMETAKKHAVSSKKKIKTASDLGIEPSRLQTRRLAAMMEGIHYSDSDSDTAGENWVMS